MAGIDESRHVLRTRRACLGHSASSTARIASTASRTARNACVDERASRSSERWCLRSAAPARLRCPTETGVSLCANCLPVPTSFARTSRGTRRRGRTNHAGDDRNARHFDRADQSDGPSRPAAGAPGGHRRRGRRGRLLSADADSDDHGEIAWRLRHLKRSVLKDVDGAIATPGSDGSFMDDSMAALARAVGGPVAICLGLHRGTAARWADQPVHRDVVRAAAGAFLARRADCRAAWPSSRSPRRPRRAVECTRRHHAGRFVVVDRRRFVRVASEGSSHNYRCRDVVCDAALSRWKRRCARGNGRRPPQRRRDVRVRSTGRSRPTDVSYGPATRVTTTLRTKISSAQKQA